MTTRLKPHELLCSVADSLVNDACWPKVQRSDTYPSIVYHIIAPEVRQFVGSGPVIIAETIRVEVRSRTFDETRATWEGLLKGLRATNRLLNITGGVDDYSDDIQVHRYIASLLII